MMFDKIKKRA